VTITARRASDNFTISTTSTWSSGGYSLALLAGTYKITTSGGSLGGIVTYNNVVIGAQNVKRDFTSSQAIADTSFATIAGGKLTVTGTTANDAISVAFNGTQFTCIRNGTSTVLNAAGVTSIDIFAYDGDDWITITGTMGAYVDAGAGNDYIQGGDGNDTITSGAGKDRALGGLGDDRLNGNGGHDQLFGGAGKDRLYGGDGNDTLDGGSSTDRLWGNAGNNVYYGQGGDDYLYARNGSADTLYGQAGTDHAQIDTGIDVINTIEDLLA